MRFQVNRDVFSEAVSFVVKLLPQRNPQPILAGVLIEEDGSGLTLSAFDYEASARTTIEATVDEPGTILVHASATLAKGLLEAGLVDRYHLLVFPILLGGGKRLFAADGGTKAKLKLVEQETYSNGVQAQVWDVV